MQTIEVSDSVYDALMSRRIGCEPISNTITRMLDEVEEDWDAEKIDADAEEFLRETKTFRSIDEVFR